MNAPGAALVARFRADVARVFGPAPCADAPIALAVSGGPDSMAMLVLAAAAYPGCVVAATVDHRLRAAAADEAAMVRDWCRAAGVRHETLALDTRIGPSAVQAQARHFRYDCLARWARAWGAGCLATAHHVEDQAETFLMRAVRGSGPAGLAGIRARREHSIMEPIDGQPLVFREATIPVVRPLLGWRRDALRAVVTDTGTPFVDDPSNDDETYERVRVRRLIVENPWLDAQGLARAAVAAAEADRTLTELRDWLWNSRDARSSIDSAWDEVWLRLGDLPREMQRRLAREAIIACRRLSEIDRPAFDQGSNVEPLLDALNAGKSATQAGIFVSAKGHIWHFREAPPRRAT